ncbi:MAG: cell division protein FtsA [bacterium]|nr:cell division protein FtsA [bacterium]
MARPNVLAVGIDAGSARTRCMVLAVEDGQIHFVGCGEASSDGWKKGRVSDQGRVSASIRRAVQAAERDSQCAVESAVVGVAGPTVWGYDNHFGYSFPRAREVGHEEMAFTVEKAAQVTLGADRMILHVCPQYFTLDGRPGYRDPRGRSCTRLEANVHVVTTSTQETHSIVSAMHQASLKVEETVFEPMAAAYASLLQEDRSRGVALVDLGLQSTGVVIYNGDALIHDASLPVSSDHLTRDVVYGLRVAYEDAEALKRQYGCAILGLTSDNSSIVVPSAEGRAPRELPRRDLNRILDARAEELFQYVAGEIERAEMTGQLAEGVVLTGAAVELPGMLDMAERVLDCHARKGLTLGVKNLPDRSNTPEWTTAAGLAMYSARLKVLKNPKPTAPGFWNLIR